MLRFACIKIELAFGCAHNTLCNSTSCLLKDANHTMMMMFAIFVIAFCLNLILCVEILGVSFDDMPQSAGKRRFFHSGVVLPLAPNDTRQIYWTFGGLTDYESVSCDVDILHLGMCA
jgi:hypothetical protein